MASASIRWKPPWCFELGSLAQRLAAVEIADAGPILLDGIWQKLNMDTLHW